MDIRNSDGQSRGERMKIVSDFSKILTTHKEAVEKEIEEKEKSVSEDIRTPISVVALTTKENALIPKITASMATLISDSHYLSAVNVIQVIESITASTGSYYQTAKDTTQAQSDIILVSINDQIAAFNTANTPANDTKILSLYKDGYGIADASSTSDAITKYFKKTVSLKLGMQWVYTSALTLDEAYSLFRDYSINQALQVSSNINFIDNHGLRARATAVLSSDSVAELQMTSGGSNYTYSPQVIFLGGGGTGAAALATITESIVSITLTNFGQGYSAPPLITFSGGGGEGAAATCTINYTGKIDSIKITNTGSGYTSLPTIIFNSYSFLVHAEAYVAIGNGKVSANLIANGSGYTTAPIVHFVGGGLEATGTALTNPFDNAIKTIHIIDGGNNYNASPNVAIVSQSTSAFGTAVLLNGTVDSITLDVAGSGYLDPPEIYIYGSGIGARATCSLIGDGSGSVDGSSIVMDDKGSGYVGTVAVLFEQGYGASATATLKNRLVDSCTVVNGGGNGIKPFPVVHIVGNGTGASAIAKIGLATIDSVKIINAGSGYTEANVVFMGSTNPANNATGNIEIKNGKIIAINITDGGSDYLYPQPIMANDAYLDYNIRKVFDYPNSVDGASASVSYYNKQLQTQLGYPAASNLTEAEIRWKEVYMTYLLNNPKIILQTTSQSQQDQLYKNEFGYPSAATVVEAKNNFYNARMEVLLNKVVVNPPIIQPKNRRDMDIVIQANTNINRNPIVKPKENQVVEINNKNKIMSIVSADNTRIDNMKNANSISFALNTNKELIDKNVQDIKDSVSFEYRYTKAYAELTDKKVADLNTATDAKDTIINDNSSTINSEANTIYSNAITKYSAEADAIVLKISIDKGAERLVIEAKIEEEVDAIIAEDGSAYIAQTVVVANNVNKDISTIRDIVQAHINQYSTFVPSVQIIGQPSGTGATAVISEIINGNGSGYNSATVSISGGDGLADANALIVGTSIVGFNITNRGSGYNSSSTVSITGDGTKAYADAIIVDGQVDAIRIREGVISDITMTSGGSGYFDTPKILISGQKGSGIIASADITNGQITGITISNGGSNYLFPPLTTTEKTELINNAYTYSTNEFTKIGGKPYIEISSTYRIPNTGFTFIEPYYKYLDDDIPNTVPTGLQTTYYDFRVKDALGYPISTNAADAINKYKIGKIKENLGFPDATTISAAGVLAKDYRKKLALGFSNAQHISIARALFMNQYVDIEFGYPSYVVSITVSNGGSGYTSNPSVEVRGGGSSGASAYTTINPSGGVSDVVLISGGIGYRYATTVSLEGGGGTGATVDSITDVSTGIINGFQNLVAGTGYTSPPRVVFSEFADPTPAVAVASINFKGEVQTVSVISPSGYCTTNPTVIFHGGGGSGATSITNKIQITSYVGSYLDWAVGKVNAILGVDDPSAIENQVKFEYLNKQLSILLGFSNAESLAVAETNYINLHYRQLFNYPNAGPSAVEENIPPSFLNRLDHRLFVINTQNQCAEVLWFYDRMNHYLTNIPAGQTQTTINQLYNTEFGYPAGSTIVYKGEGYTQETYVEIDGDGNGANAIPYIVDGVIMDIIVIDPGVGYTKIPKVIVKSKSSGSGVIATATLNATLGVDDISVSNGGTNYIAAPIVRFRGGKSYSDATAVAIIDNNGRIIDIDVVNPGTGYTQPPVISFLGTTRDDVIVATATANLGAGPNYEILSFNMTTNGLGYIEVPRVFIRRADDAVAVVRIDDTRSVAHFKLISGGSNYTSIPDVFIEANPNGNIIGRGARPSINISSGSVIIDIPVSDAEQGYKNIQSEILFNKLEVSGLSSSTTLNGMSFQTNMNIESQSITHEERVYGRKIQDTQSDSSYMTLLSDKSTTTLKQRIAPTNMSISQKNNTHMTRQQRINKNNTYLTMYRQAEAMVKVKLIKDSPTIYTPEQQKQLLYDELAKIPARKSVKQEPTLPTIIDHPFSTIRNDNKKFTSTTNLSHNQRLEYNSQRYIIQENVNTLIAELERNRGGSMIVNITTNGGSNYLNPLVVDISAPDATISSAAATSEIDEFGQLSNINMISNGSGYPSDTPIEIIGGGGNGAEVQGIIDNGVITRIEITKIGSGYKSAPTVLIPQTAIQATASAVADYGIIKTFTLTEKGFGYTTQPTITINATNQPGSGVNISSTLKNASINEIFINNTIDDIVLVNGGKNFKYAPDIVFSTGNAIATCTLNANKTINSNITIDNAGSRFILPPTIKLAMSLTERQELEEKYLSSRYKKKFEDNELPEDGESTPDDAIPFGGISKINKVKLIAKDSELTKQTFEARTEALRAYRVLLENISGGTTATATAVVVNGVITSVSMDNKGSGYILSDTTTLEPITISITHDSGHDAELKANVNFIGEIESINVINGGLGYVPDPPVLIVSSPKTQENFNILIKKSRLLTSELYKATGINLEPSVDGVSKLKSLKV